MTLSRKHAATTETNTPPAPPRNETEPEYEYTWW